MELIETPHVIIAGTLTRRRVGPGKLPLAASVLVPFTAPARPVTSADLAEITAEVGDASEAAFVGNLAAISLSAADFGREFDARSSFLRTGQLPIPDQLPKTVATQMEPPAQNDDQAQGDPDAEGQTALGGEARAA